MGGSYRLRIKRNAKLNRRRVTNIKRGSLNALRPRKVKPLSRKRPHPSPSSPSWVGLVPRKQSKGFDNHLKLQQRFTEGNGFRSHPGGTPDVKWAPKRKRTGFDRWYHEPFPKLAKHFAMPVAQGLLKYAVDRNRSMGMYPEWKKRK